jgi:asparagine synthase (glutamine-hydrolysing)
MLRAMGHRGPDDQGVEEICPHVWLGNTRLAVLDLSKAGHQPMHDPETGNWIVYNGEVYNFKALRADISGSNWRSNTDSEVVLRAYSRWGKACLEHLRGMFAFAVWDSKHQELFLARDRLGIKPLYYYHGEGFLLFASEVRALLASGLVPRKIDPSGLWDYLGYQTVPTPRTIVNGVRVIPQGHMMSIKKDGHVQIHCYWDLLQNASIDSPSPTDARKRIRELLLEAVELRLISDVPLGIFLSGGIDSSAVAGLVRELGKTPKTFSIVFSHPVYDESSFSRTVANRFKAEHTEIQLHEKELLELLPDALCSMDHPTGDGINTFLISHAVGKAGLKVALSGLGGDELFTGYPSFTRLEKLADFFRLWTYAPSTIKALTARGIRLLGNSVRTEKTAALLESDGSLASAYPVMRQVFLPIQRRKMLRPEWLSQIKEEFDQYIKLLQTALVSVKFSCGNVGCELPLHKTTERERYLLTFVSYAEARTYMHDLLLRDTDQMSMAHSLEVRVPLLDHRLAEYVMGLPDSIKAPNGTPKRLLVESLNGILPEEIIKRPKQGFVLPFDPWMRGALKGFCEGRLMSLAERGIFLPAAIKKLWEDFLAGRKNVTWSRIWVLVALEEWMERNGMWS